MPDTMHNPSIFCHMNLFCFHLNISLRNLPKKKKNIRNGKILTKSMQGKIQDEKKFTRENSHVNPMNIQHTSFH